MSVPYGQIDNKPPFFQLITWRLTEGKPFPEPVTTQI